MSKYTVNPNTFCKELTFDYDDVKELLNVEDSAEQIQYEDIAEQCDSYSEYEVRCAIHGIEARNKKDFRRDKILAEARRRSRFSYSADLAEDIQALHGIDIQKEMKEILANEIAREIDRQLLNDTLNSLNCPIPVEYQC